MSKRGGVTGRYQVGHLIGQGAMGSVYYATDTATGQPVSIKALNKDIVSLDPTLVERFKREGEALRRLNHPNIVKVLDTVEQDGTQYLIMEYVGGGTLRDLLTEQPILPLERVLSVSLELADALTRAHHLGIIHRDLKPSNIMLAEDGTVRLADFGIAQFRNLKSITQPGRIMGTWTYLSPEAYMDMPLDARSDIWAFGVLLFEMLAGTLPFRGENMAMLVNAIVNDPTPDLGALRPDLPDALLDLVYRMLSKNRSDRIPSVRLVGAEIEALLFGLDLSSMATPLVTLKPGSAPHKSTFDTPTPGTKPHHNLPTQTTPFVGRETILQDLAIQLTDYACRLLTLLGPGGMGKTRLGIELAARQMNRYPDGVVFVPLAPLSSPDQMVAAIAEAIDYQFAREADPRQQLLDQLRHQELLLVLDNFEHLIEGAGLVAEILHAAPHMRLIVTSRTRLNLHEECIHEVRGMEFPDDHAFEASQTAFEDYEAVKLFMAYARRAQPGYELAEEDRLAVQRICQIVGGMPLGIELAATWVRMLSPSEVADELECDLDFLQAMASNVPDRQRSMRAAFDYSWNLLTAQEQDSLKRLAVCRGGFTREAAQNISGASVRTLVSLTDQSLLRRDPAGRYDFHELLRQFAMHQLNENPDDATEAHTRHWQYFARFLHQRAADIRGPTARQGLMAIEREYQNIRAAWDWAIRSGDFAPMGDTLLSLHQFLYAYGREREENLLYYKALAGMPDPLPDDLIILHYQLRALLVSGTVDYDQRREHIMTTLPDIREKGLEGAIGWLFPHLVMASSTYLNGVDAAQIRDIRDRLLALAADQADPWLASITMMAAGNVTIADLHEVETGQNYLWEALALSRKIGESFWRGWMLGSLADWARWGGDYDLAGALYTEAYELAMHLRDRPLTASLLWRLGRTDEAQGLSEQAREKLLASMALAREIGVRPFIAVPLYLLGSLEARDGHFDAARSYYAEAYSLLVDDADPQLMSFCLYNHALGALEQGDYQRAKECAQESLEWMRKASHTDWWTAVIKLGEAEYGLGNVETARAHFQSALLGSQGAVALRPDIPHGLIVYAILLADEGQAERAVELLGRALSDQAIFAHDRAQAQAMITALAETLSAEAFAAARVRGETATVEELMIGLQQAAG